MKTILIKAPIAYKSNEDYEDNALDINYVTLYHNCITL
jgi:hypothetical protein